MCSTYRCGTYVEYFVFPQIGCFFTLPVEKSIDFIINFVYIGVKVDICGAMWIINKKLLCSTVNTDITLMKKGV